MFPRTATALTELIARARVAAHVVNAEGTEQARMRYRTAFMEAGEHEHAHLARGLIDALGGTEAMSPGLRDLFERASGPTAQFDWLLELTLLIAGIFSVAGTLVAPEIQDLLNKRWENNLDMPVSVQELALGELRGFLTHDRATKLARETGYSPDKYDIIYNDTGEPPAIQELLFLFRRGKIDAARLEHGIRQSRVRDEWIDAIRALEFVPPSPQEAIAAAVQGHLTIEEAATVVAENGVDPTTVPWLYETAGRPPGAEMLLTLMHRGLMSQADVEAAIRESDIKNKYIPAIIQGGVYIPPVRSVVAMLRAGAIDDNQARTLFTENGVRDSDASAYIAEAHKSRAVATHEAAQGQVVTAYRDRMITRTAAQARLEALKYPAADATFLLDVADTEAETVLRRGVITTTRSKYVGHHIDHGTASGALDKVGVPADQRDHLLALWDVERAETVRTLTPAVLVKGVKNGAVTYAEMISYMVALGYSDKDAALYAKIEGVGP